MAYAFKLPDGSLTRDVAMVRATNSAANQISSLKSTANYNNAYSASQAKIQRDWQEQQNAKAMTFNAQQAALNRDWQAMMSNTAHQREVKDLQAAGLNPVLSAMNGNGAAVTSGATASGVTSAGAKGETDMSMNSALVNLLGSIYNRTTQLEAANINARTQEAVADKYNATSQIVAQIGAAASRYGSDKSSEASKYASNKAFLAALNAAEIGLTGTKYTADSSKEVALRKPSNVYDAMRYIGENFGYILQSQGVDLDKLADLAKILGYQ